MQVFDWFKIIYGPETNKEKTIVIEIGPFRDKCKCWEGKFVLTWTNDFEVFGISYNMKRMDDITEDNILKKIKGMKNLISVWKRRTHISYGKVVIIKSLLFSKITHILMSLPSSALETFLICKKWLIMSFGKISPRNFGRKLWRQILRMEE